MAAVAPTAPPPTSVSTSAVDVRVPITIGQVARLSVYLSACPSVPFYIAMAFVSTRHLSSCGLYSYGLRVDTASN